MSNGYHAPVALFTLAATTPPDRPERLRGPFAPTPAACAGTRPRPLVGAAVHLPAHHTLGGRSPLSGLDVAEVPSGLIGDLFGTSISLLRRNCSPPFGLVGNDLSREQGRSA